jgi:tetratricopeptide (TPR) repeat protein
VKRTAWLSLLWILLIVGGVALGRQNARFSPLLAHTQRDRGDILLDVFGEFRTVLARYLWFKTDLFHEVLEVQGSKADKETELLPLMRMVSLLDPSMTEAYDSLAYDLSRGHQKMDEALKLLDEGLALNPASFQLNFRRSLLLYREKRYEEAVRDGKQALEVASDEFDQLNAARILYWSAKHINDREAMVMALDRLQALRPDEPLWAEERASLDR